MKLFTFFLLTIFSSSIFADAVECNVLDGKTVMVAMIAPHPSEALIDRPNGETVWLQMNEDLKHEQIEDFENLTEWHINKNTLGTVYVDGAPEAQPIITVKGRYHLYIAENTETERDNTHHMECYFTINE